jgi:Fe-S cluster biogenesis protein NfuA
MTFEEEIDRILRRFGSDGNSEKIRSQMENVKARFGCQCHDCRISELLLRYRKETGK